MPYGDVMDIWPYRLLGEITDPGERERLHTYWGLVQAWKGKTGPRGKRVTLNAWPPTTDELTMCLEAYPLPERLTCRACNTSIAGAEVPVRDALVGRNPLGAAPFCPNCLAAGWEILDVSDA